MPRRPSPPPNVVLVLTDDMRYEEFEKVARFREFAREGRRSSRGAALDGLGPRAGRVYVHLDLDVLDPAKAGRANEFAPEGGLGVDELLAALRMVRGRFEVAACGIASYDPALDEDGRVLRAALAWVEELAVPTPPV